MIPVAYDERGEPQEGVEVRDIGSRLDTSISEQDSDGDGVSDAQEEIDMTDPNDTGSFILRLKSPAYTKYNTFLEQFNFLELTATGENPVEVVLSIYDINGNKIELPTEKSEFTIGSLQQVDVDIHSLVERNTYGVVKIEFNEGPNTSLRGRMSNYKLNADGQTYSFAFSKELRNPSRGASYATANSFDPQGRGFIVPNWLELINLDAVTREFTYKIYAGDGSLIESSVVTIPARGEIDFQAGHLFGEGVYLVEILPADGATEYFSTVTRYSSNEVNFVGDSFNFAIPIDARSGTGDVVYAPITNRTGDCWRQTNWVEIVNTKGTTESVKASFYDNEGNELEVMRVELKGKEQRHINASGILALRSDISGSVKIEGNSRDSIISQSLVYYQDCNANGLQTAYASTARISAGNAQLGTFNSFLNISNQLTVISAVRDLLPTVLTTRYFSIENALVEDSQNRELQSLDTLAIDFSETFDIPDNRNGIILLDSGEGRVVVENLRVRTVNGKVDFAMPTVVQ